MKLNVIDCCVRLTCPRCTLAALGKPSPYIDHCSIALPTCVWTGGLRFKQESTDKQTDRQTDATKRIISPASRSIIMSKHNLCVALYHCCGAQHRFHKPRRTYGQAEATKHIVSPPLMVDNKKLLSEPI